MRHKAVFLFPAWIAFTLARPAAAQKFLPKAILFKGDPEYSNQEMMEAAGLKKGEILSYVSMNGVAQQLMNTGMFDGVSFKFDGQDLVFYLTPASQLLPVKLENLPFPAGEDVSADLHSQIPLYHGKVPVTGGVMDKVTQDLEKMLAANGIQATVTGIVSGDQGSLKPTAMTYSVTSPPVLVKVIGVEGVSPPFQSKVQGILDDLSKNPFDANTSVDSLEREVGLFYEDQGYAAAKVQAMRSGNAALATGSILVPFTVTVQEGRLYKLAGVQLPAGTPIMQADVDKLLAERPGGPNQGVRLRGVWERIADSYKAKGYLDCKVTPHPRFDNAGGTVSYTVDIDPGPVYHLGFLKFDNVSDGTRMLLMRYWQMMPGDVFDQSYVEMFIPNARRQDRTLMQTLRGANVKYVETEDLVNHTVNLVIRLGDKSTASAAK